MVTHLDPPQYGAARRVVARQRPAQWPVDLLDVATLRSDGWRPVPVRQFVLKIHSRCNLACSYCYMYELADQSWRNQPVTMADDVLDATLRGIVDHAKEHQLTDVRVVFHGGEPLLAGAAKIAATVARLRRSLGATGLDAVVQTNGVLLDAQVLDALVEQDVRVGVSIDGGESANARRRHRDGRSSYDEVARALSLLAEPPYRRHFAGVLAVVDLEADPVRTYDDLLGFSPPAMDFLLPHATWSSPPPGRGEGSDSSATPYADWLSAVFDRWFDAPQEQTAFLLGREVVDLILGGVSRRAGIGLAPSTVVVVETDGAIEAVDALKATYPGAATTGYHVRRDSFDTVLTHPTLVAQQIGTLALADQCRRCRVRDVCGGGYYPHRYQADAGFRNPSVYCPDLITFVDHVRLRVATQLAPDLGRTVDAR